MKILKEKGNRKFTINPINSATVWSVGVPVIVFIICLVVIPMGFKDHGQSMILVIPMFLIPATIPLILIDRILNFIFNYNFLNLLELFLIFALIFNIFLSSKFLPLD